MFFAVLLQLWFSLKSGEGVVHYILTPPRLSFYPWKFSHGQETHSKPPSFLHRLHICLKPQLTYEQYQKITHGSESFPDRHKFLRFLKKMKENEIIRKLFTNFLNWICLIWVRHAKKIMMVFHALFRGQNDFFFLD